MGNTATLQFAGDASALEKAAARARQATDGVGDSAARSADQMRAGAAEAQQYGSRMGQLGSVATGLSTAIGDVGTSAQALADFQARGATRAAAHARALADMRQATLDAEQAQQDLKQSVADANQALTDGKQAVLDVAQAQQDLSQANLDAEKASQAYSQAVTEFGAGSMEARQAQLDLSQAQRDQQQATLDAEQAQRDAEQATLDYGQAQTDAKQALENGKRAQLDYNQAQREANPPDMKKFGDEVAAYASVAQGAASTIMLMAMAYEALNLAAIKSTVSLAAQKVATLASSAAAGIATAAQWLWNVAMSANPIGLIVIGIAALVAAIVWVATQTTWFQDLWKVVWGAITDAASAAWGWITGAARSAWDYLSGLPDRLGGAFSRVGSLLSAPFRAAFNWISDAWNNTVGRLSWTVPDWVPGIGGSGISAPRLPRYHQGGVVPGALGSEQLAVLQAGETVLPAGQSPVMQVVLKADGSRASALVLELLREAMSIRGGNLQLVRSGL